MAAECGSGLPCHGLLVMLMSFMDCGRVDGQVLSVSFHLTWPLEGQIGHTVSRRSTADPAASRRGGSLPAGPLRGHVAVGLVKSSYLAYAMCANTTYRSCRLVQLYSGLPGTSNLDLYLEGWGSVRPDGALFYSWGWAQHLLPAGKSCCRTLYHRARSHTSDMFHPQIPPDSP